MEKSVGGGVFNNSNGVVVPDSSNMSLDFSHRAKQLRTPAQTAKIDAKVRELSSKSLGLSKQCWWREHVHSEEDAVLYFQIYYPMYSEEMCRSMALFMTELATKRAQGETIDEKYVRRFNRCTGEEILSQREKELSQQRWDYKSEVAQHKLAGQLNLCKERMDKFLNCDETTSSTKQQQQQQQQ